MYLHIFLCRLPLSPLAQGGGPYTILCVIRSPQVASHCMPFVVLMTFPLPHGLFPWRIGQWASIPVCHTVQGLLRSVIILALAKGPYHMPWGKGEVRNLTETWSHSFKNIHICSQGWRLMPLGNPNLRRKRQRHQSCIETLSLNNTENFSSFQKTCNYLKKEGGVNTHTHTPKRMSNNWLKTDENKEPNSI